MVFPLTSCLSLSMQTPNNVAKPLCHLHSSHVPAMWIWSHPCGPLLSVSNHQGNKEEREEGEEEKEKGEQEGKKDSNEEEE